MPTVDDGIKTQLRNIEKTYGHSIEELTAIISKSGLTKHTEVVAMLKARYHMAHGAAHRVSIVARERLGTSPKGKGQAPTPTLRPIYDRLMTRIQSLGQDVGQVEKKGYVSLRRSKQFAMLQPGAKWINLGLILPGVAATERLESAAKWNALFTHRVRVSEVGEVDREVESWLRAAYAAAGSRISPDR